MSSLDAKCLATLLVKIVLWFIRWLIGTGPDKPVTGLVRPPVTPGKPVLLVQPGQDPLDPIRCLSKCHAMGHQVVHRGKNPLVPQHTIQ